MIDRKTRSVSEALGFSLLFINLSLDSFNVRSSETFSACIDARSKTALHI